MPMRQVVKPVVMDLCTVGQQPHLSGYYDNPKTQEPLIEESKLFKSFERVEEDFKPGKPLLCWLPVATQRSISASDSTELLESTLRISIELEFLLHLLEHAEPISQRTLRAIEDYLERAAPIIKENITLVRGYFVRKLRGLLAHKKLVSYLAERKQSEEIVNRIFNGLFSSLSFSLRGEDTFERTLKDLVGILNLHKTDNPERVKRYVSEMLSSCRELFDSSSGYRERREFLQGMCNALGPLKNFFSPDIFVWLKEKHDSLCREYQEVKKNIETTEPNYFPLVFTVVLSFMIGSNICFRAYTEIHAYQKIIGELVRDEVKMLNAPHLFSQKTLAAFQREKEFYLRENGIENLAELHNYLSSIATVVPLVAWTLSVLIIILLPNYINKRHQKIRQDLRQRVFESPSLPAWVTENTILDRITGTGEESSITGNRANM
eukprot:TRINITY_DN42350_c0_g1_i1.p1 TRINITY_DN42350_c0_g1~~TRINITY_DN42350_c0_g1_i1.p1  ORF type:complete len:435 (+),score=-81.95 TRINITY_DN42350_c0_g1_i1:121-1425(+)